MLGARRVDDGDWDELGPDVDVEFEGAGNEDDDGAVVDEVESQGVSIRQAIFVHS